MSENLKIKLKRILCLVIGFLTFNSISAVAVEKAIEGVTRVLAI